MEKVVGDAVFKSFPDERFRFIVGRVDGVGRIQLTNQTSKKSWECEVADIGVFAPAGVMLPPNTVLHSVAASLKESSTGAKQGLELLRGEGDKTLQLEVLITLGVMDIAWAPVYVFPMTLVSEENSSPSEQINILNNQVQELQQEVTTLKTQMKAVLEAQNPPLRIVSPLQPSQPFSIRNPSQSTAPETFQPKTVVKDREISSTSNRRERRWENVIVDSSHKLVKIKEYRENQDSSGETERRHCQRACKVCSALQGERRHPFQTCHYCVECTKRREGGVVFLCNKVRPRDAAEYQNATCSQIWHTMWNNGENMPKLGVSVIRMRKKLKPEEGGSTPADM